MLRFAILILLIGLSRLADGQKKSFSARITELSSNSIKNTQHLKDSINGTLHEDINLGNLFDGIVKNFVQVKDVNVRVRVTKGDEPPVYYNYVVTDYKVIDYGFDRTSTKSTTQIQPDRIRPTIEDASSKDQVKTFAMLDNFYIKFSSDTSSNRWLWYAVAASDKSPEQYYAKIIDGIATINNVVPTANDSVFVVYQENNVAKTIQLKRVDEITRNYFLKEYHKLSNADSATKRRNMQILLAGFEKRENVKVQPDDFSEFLMKNDLNSKKD